MKELNVNDFLYKLPERVQNEIDDFCYDRYMLFGKNALYELHLRVANYVQALYDVGAIDEEQSQAIMKYILKDD